MTDSQINNLSDEELKKELKKIGDIKDSLQKAISDLDGLAEEMTSEYESGVSPIAQEVTAAGEELDQLEQEADKEEEEAVKRQIDAA